MEEERALLKAIIAHPDEDTPRLVYADWLQEHDQPERAEFIRVQVESWRLVVGTPTQTRYDDLSRRNLELFQAYGRRWSEEFAATLPKNRQTYFGFRRGLIGDLECSPKYFNENAKALVGAAPFECLSLHRPTPRTLQETTSNPHFRHFRTLRLNADQVKAQTIQPLLNSDLRHLRRFAVTSFVGYTEPPPEWASRNTELVERIAGCSSLDGLDVLDLSRCGVGELGASALTTATALARLRVLILTGNGLSEAVQSRLRERFGQRVYFDYSDYRGRLTFGDLR